MRADLLIRDALVAPGGEQFPFFGWVAVEGDRIAAVGKGEAPQGAFRTVLDGRRRALMPGLVNAHAHSHSSLTRGSAEGRALGDWLQAIEREQAVLTDAQAGVGARATYAEALLSGTTTILDMCLRPEPVLAAAESLGIRAVVAPYVAGSKPFAPTLMQTEALLHAPRGPAVQVWVGLHDLESCGDDEVRAGATLAARHRTGLHLHCAETRFQLAATRDRTGRTPVAQLDHLGALHPRCVLAHAVWTEPEDHALLAARGAHVVHCPHANLKLGSGVAPVSAMLKAGVNVALGSDGAKANNRLDMFDAMKFASLLAKGVARDPALLPPEHVFALATRNGALALGIEAGSIGPGMLADLVLVRTDRLHLTPATPDTILPNLVHAARGSDVDTVLVGGRVVVQAGKLCTVDERSVQDELSATAAALIAQANMPGGTVRP